MSEIIIAHEKHGTTTYSHATTLLNQRICDGYWYYGEDAEAAEQALEGGEDTAWAFLEARSDYEYEGVELQEVQ